MLMNSNKEIFYPFEKTRPTGGQEECQSKDFWKSSKFKENIGKDDQNRLSQISGN